MKICKKLNYININENIKKNIKKPLKNKIKLNGIKRWK